LQKDILSKAIKMLKENNICQSIALRVVQALLPEHEHVVKKALQKQQR